MKFWLRWLEAIAVIVSFLVSLVLAFLVPIFFVELVPWWNWIRAILIVVWGVLLWSVVWAVIE